MTDLSITTTTGTSTALDETTVQVFKTSLRGHSSILATRATTTRVPSSTG